MPVIRTLLAVLLLVAVGSELSGCGKKGDLEPPPKQEETKNKS